MSIYAAIQGGAVRNIIQSDTFPERPGVVFVNIEQVAPRPSIGWAYSDGAFTAPPPPPPIEIYTIPKHMLLRRMTEVEVQGWLRAAQRALSTNSPTVADRRALYSVEMFRAMNDVLDLSSNDVRYLGETWVALGMSQQRAMEILLPIIEG